MTSRFLYVILTLSFFSISYASEQETSHATPAKCKTKLTPIVLIKLVTLHYSKEKVATQMPSNEPQLKAVSFSLLPQRDTWYDVLCGCTRSKFDK